MDPCSPQEGGRQLYGDILPCSPTTRAQSCPEFTPQPCTRCCRLLAPTKIIPLWSAINLLTGDLHPTDKLLHTYFRHQLCIHNSSATSALPSLPSRSLVLRPLPGDSPLCARFPTRHPPPQLVPVLRRSFHFPVRSITHVYSAPVFPVFPERRKQIYICSRRWQSAS